VITIPEKYRGRSFVSPDEAAEIFGIDTSTFYRRVMPSVYAGVIQSLKIGGCRRISLASLLRWAEGEFGQQAA
jgi:hypothetical protein